MSQPVFHVGRQNDSSQLLLRQGKITTAGMGFDRESLGEGKGFSTRGSQPSMADRIMFSIGWMGIIIKALNYYFIVFYIIQLITFSSRTCSFSFSVPRRNSYSGSLSRLFSTLPATERAFIFIAPRPAFSSLVGPNRNCYELHEFVVFLLLIGSGYEW